ncbi:MAG: HYR domain-containing protein [Saprospiraceae bacterium]
MKLFIISANGDEAIWKNLKTHLNLDEKVEIIRAFTDDKTWSPETNRQLSSSDAMLILVSPAYIKSIPGKHAGIAARIFQENFKSKPTVAHLVLADCDWKKPPLDHLKQFPRDEKPLISDVSSDEQTTRYKTVAAEIRNSLEIPEKTAQPSILAQPYVFEIIQKWFANLSFQKIAVPEKAIAFFKQLSELFRKVDRKTWRWIGAALVCMVILVVLWPKCDNSQVDKNTTLSISLPKGKKGFILPKDTTLIVPAGESDLKIKYLEPIAETTCPGGEAKLKRKDGPASGAAFPLRKTTVQFVATDSCGNTASYSFSVTVEVAETVKLVQPPPPSPKDIDPPPSTNFVCISGADIEKRVQVSKIKDNLRGLTVRSKLHIAFEIKLNKKGAIRAIDFVKGKSSPTWTPSQIVLIKNTVETITFLAGGSNILKDQGTIAIYFNGDTGNCTGKRISF